MPVPTETFWNIRKLNAAFAVSALLLTFSVFWLILADYNHDWRGYQQNARVWETAMIVDAQAQADAAGQNIELEKIKTQIAELDARLDHKAIADREQEIAALKEKNASEDLPMAAKKGEIGPLTQEIEAARLADGDDAKSVTDLRKKLAAIQLDYDAMATKQAERNILIQNKTAELAALRAQVIELGKQRDDLQRKKTALEEKLAALDPHGTAFLADKIRDMPLANWMNPREQVQQVIVTGVRTNLNMVETETIDRCATCHINIDKPQFAPENLVPFVERQVAIQQRQDVNALDHPVVLLDFWTGAIKDLAQAAKDDFHRQSLLAAVAKIRQSTLDRINTARTEADPKAKPVASLDGLDAEVARIQKYTGKDLKPFYLPLVLYRQDLAELLRMSLGKEQYKQLQELYRRALIAEFNAGRAAAKLPPVDPNPVLLGHPQIELFVDAASKHPIKVMGCTVCHEGSGQEADFTHTAHVPRDIWVDADTGASIPDSLVTRVGERKEIRDAVRKSHEPAAVAQAPAQIINASLPAPGGEPAAGHPARAAEGVASQYDVNLASPENPAPFAPQPEIEGPAAAYRNPTDASGGSGTSGGLRLAVRQSDYWTKRYHWENVEHKDWEYPMNSLEFIESSCAKCHTEIFDLKDSAPTLFEGRKLFAQLGCVNCHGVKDLEQAGDTTIKVDKLDENGQPTGQEITIPRKVGPSLVHVKDKLSPLMIGSWVWAPKAFRPTTRMPHFFMLENNSSPADILRTRVEVAAITHYLINSTPSPAIPTADYTPEPPPANPGDAEAGRKVFSTVGCLACHSNLAENGDYLVVNDLVKNQGLSVDAASKKYKEMSYNERQWYAIDHLGDKLINIGPELSAVGSKLTIGRTPEQARTWVYDWVRNPRHYSSYTIMPSFRLSPEQANDLSAYLLTLKRDDYKPENFLDLKEPQKQMLLKLVATLKAAQSTYKLALDDIQGKGPRGSAAAMSQDDQLLFLGQKMIANYSCNGCHLINGFEASTSACVSLSDEQWGLKDPHKLDFGYFDHAFDKDREKPITVAKVRHEGLAANAPQIDYNDSKDIGPVALKWEEIELERRPWAYNKLHNPRVYDRGRTSFEGKLTPTKDAAGNDSVNVDEVGKPYDKLKMPKFFLKDEQVHALVTFVTSIRRPLVTRELQDSAYDSPHRRWAYGQQVATLFNCYGCHNIEGETAHIRDYFDYLPTGEFNPNGYKWAPPRLIGQGAKTQPEWVYHFLQNVDPRPIRPWLQVRMPSFPIGAAHAGHIADYFAGQSQVLAKDLKTWITGVEDALKLPVLDPDADPKAWADAMAKWLETNPGRQDWFDAAPAAPFIAHLHDFALKFELVKPRDIDPRTADPDARRDAWKKLWFNLHILQKTYDIHYPYVPQSRPDITPERFRRGEQFILQIGCMTGNCHSKSGDFDALDQMAEIDRKAADATAKPPASQPAIDDPYGDTPKPSPKPAATKPAEPDDPYGEAPKTTTKPAATGSGDDYGDTTTPAAKPTNFVGHWFPAASPGEPGSLGAPNLIRVGYRLQRPFVNQWVQHAPTLMPGTWMLEFFTWPDLDNTESPRHGTVYPTNPALDNLYGYTGQEQRDLLLDYLYAASDRNYTPGAAEKLYGIKPLPRIETPLPPPPPLKVKPGAATQPATTTAPPPVKPETAPVKPPVAEPLKSNIELQDQPAAPYKGTRIVGVIKYAGPSPRRRIIPTDIDKNCSAAHPDTPLKTDNLIVNDGTLCNAFIYVKSGLPAGQSFPIPPDKQNPVVSNVGCAYVPHVLGIVAGQSLKFVNDDPTLHNVKMESQKNGAFNETLNGKGAEKKRKFLKPEMDIPLQCSVHTWMLGVLHVMDNPFFAVSDVEGRFEITGLPPGRYTLEAIHEDGPEKLKIAPVAFEVEVKPDTSVRADATLK